MAQNSTEELPEIRAADEEELVQILEMALSHLEPLELKQRIGASMTAYGRGLLPLEGILQARRGKELCGAIFSMYRSDGTVIFWPPGTLRDEPLSTYTVLLEGMERYCLKVNSTMQLLFVDDSQIVDPELLSGFGLKYLSDLLYMIATEDRFPKLPLRKKLSFHPLFESEPNEPENPISISEIPKTIYTEYRELVDRTYLETKDFPELIGVCPTEEVLKGYREDCVFRAELWQFIRMEDRNIGALILSDHPEDNFLELTYMGLVPEVRGKKLAREIVEHALCTAGELGRRFVLVSVDAQNESAYLAYRNRGFRTWDRKSIYMKKRNEK